MNKHLNVLTHTGHIKSLNWVASCVNKLDDTLPRFMGAQWDSVQTTHGMSAEAYAWKTTLGWGRTRPEFLIVSWTIATRGALWACVCHVVRFIPLQGFLLIRISGTPSNMGDGLFAAPKLLLSYCYLYHEMDINYLVVDEMINVSKLFDYTCMLRVWCKPMMLIT
jgi:hypothetical protein